MGATNEDKDKIFESQAADAKWHVNSLVAYVQETEGRIGESSEEPRVKALKSLLTAYRTLVEEFDEQYRRSLKKAFKDSKVRKEEFPIEMHQAIEKLSDEWNRVFQIAATVRASTAQHDFFMPLIQTAAEDIGLQNAEGYTDFLVLPQFGSHFSLVSFKYAPHILSLGVPVFNLHTPWELSVIWHEMAGRKVRDMKEKDPDVFQRLIPSSYNPPAETSPEQDEGASDGDIQVGWTVGWMEELFEDGCSVLAFEDAFLPIFKNILFRYSNAVDSRHPRMNVRLAMAIMLLRLSQLDEVIEETRAKDILVASDEKYPGLGLKELAESEAEIILEAANAIHAKLAEECPGLKELTESKARDTILKAMEDYSALPKEGDDHVAISDIITKTESTLKELIRERQTSKDEPDVEALVKSLVTGKSYTDLLAEPLSEIDFAVGEEHPSHTEDYETITLTFRAHDTPHTVRLIHHHDPNASSLTIPGMVPVKPRWKIG